MVTPFSAPLVERGSGPPLVLIPGVQGRWEYSRGLVEELAKSYHVITFSLCDERHGARSSCRMDVFANQVEHALDKLHIDRAHIVGVSFGGLAALRFAATRPHRTNTLALVSAPGPRWHLRPRHDVYARLPWVFGPIFLLESPFRLRQEIMAALPTWRARRAYLREQLRTIATAPVSLGRMGARARLIGSYDRISDCARVTAPSLVLQGDDELDHVTGSGGTSQYASLITSAKLVQLPQTGHLGSVTKAGDCASIIHGFITASTKDSQNSAA